MCVERGRAGHPPNAGILQLSPDPDPSSPPPPVPDHGDHAPERPSLRALRRGLEEVFVAEIAVRGPLRVAARRENPRSSTYVADVVLVCFADGSSERVLCKFSHGAVLTPPTPHRGLAFEVAVYRDVLREAPPPLPRFWGGFTDAETGDFVLVMRFYPEALTAAQAPENRGVHALIDWLAAFHAWGEGRVADPTWGFLPRLDAPVHEAWLAHTLAMAGPAARGQPWLDRAAAAYRDRIPLLATAPPTLIHGELTTRNGIWTEGRVLPIDWETAAIGPGEIDLAVFTYDWHPDDLREIEARYVQARWNGSAPTGFAETLLAARVYVAFHWLFGDATECDADRVTAHLEALHAELRRFGLV